MKPKLTFLLSLTFLFLFSGSVYGDDFQDGVDAAKKGDYKEAVKWFRLSAEQGNADGQYELGLMYFKGQGVPQDYKEAVKWYRLAAEQGVAQAQLLLGSVYYLVEQPGIPHDYEKAIKWYRLAAEQGETFAQLLLGRIYYRGQGVPQDDVSAHMWLNLCGSNGYKDAVKNRDIIEKEMSKIQIEKAQEMARNWKPTKK
jgi:uncharacterized protein